MFSPFYRITDWMRGGACILALLALGMGERAWGQGIERESLSGQAAAEAAKGTDSQPYNLSLGPVGIRLETGVSTAYNDNINIAYTGRQGDCIITPSLTIHGLWQATDVNALTFDIQLGYQWYTIHSGNSSLNIAPNSQTEFNIYAGDFKINLHDRFSFTSNPIVVGQLSGVSQFPVFVNTAGLRVDWDLSDVILSMGYDHTNQWLFNSDFNYLNYQQDTISPRVSVKVSDMVNAGVSSAFSSMRYEQGVQNNNLSMQVGPFVEAKLGSNLSVNGQAGAQLASYDSGGTNGDTSTSLAGFYGSAGINHRISDVLTESLTAGQEFMPGITSNYTKRIYADYIVGWQATSVFTVNGDIWYENLDDSNATFRQTANRIGANLTLAYNITDRLTTSLGYQYVIKMADPSALGYSQDVVTLGLNYKF